MELYFFILKFYLCCSVIIATLYTAYFHIFYRLSKLGIEKLTVQIDAIILLN